MDCEVGYDKYRYPRTGGELLTFRDQQLHRRLLSSVEARAGPVWQRV